MVSDGDGMRLDGDADSTIKQAADKVGFNDDGIPGKLYTFWWKHIHRGVQNWDCYGPEEAGTSRWDAFCEWAAGQPTMAPRGQLEYQNESIRKHVRILCDDIAKKARTSRQGTWNVVHQARAAYQAANNGGPANIEPPKWPLPATQELGAATTGPSYMPRNPKGKGSVLLQNATTELNAEKTRVTARGPN
ncbi:hypothetical protein L211DRAFT_853014 [Terfezia boudieri ATCC MYA-4762]|uniref:Uncharacterized protein n=1 Tax=Terfezia boudieri ATCC MYA-4762 TaxID=1051890 RepID=A0A3N4LDT6_9PEZI|nr:hypothetical protein L211DRAFT_853014 [Terfezia boudieri ATCC MYA-4762]